jgi:hypothetical protein
MCPFQGAIDQRSESPARLLFAGRSFMFAFMVDETKATNLLACSRWALGQPVIFWVGVRLGMTGWKWVFGGK